MGLPWENMDAIPCGKTWHAIDHALLIYDIVHVKSCCNPQNDFIKKNGIRLCAKESSLTWQTIFTR